MLSASQTDPQSASRPLRVTFDEGTKALNVTDRERTYSFATVSISSVTINGLGHSVSIGIDRSSLGVVWQQYLQDTIKTEFGLCQTPPKD